MGKTGKPYKFAQQLAGLKVLTKEVPMVQVPFELPADKLGVESAMDSFVKSVCFRLAASDSLYKQVKMLTQRTVTPVANYSLPQTVRISSCSKITQSQYKDAVTSNSSTATNILESLAYEDQPHATFLRMRVSNGSRSNEVFVYLSASYPLVPPLFTLPSVSPVPVVPAFVQDSADPSALSLALSSSNPFDQELMKIEQQLNTYNPASVGSNKQKILLLSIQIYKLLNLFEEYYNSSS